MDILPFHPMCSTNSLLQGEVRKTFEVIFYHLQNNLFHFVKPFIMKNLILCCFLLLASCCSMYAQVYLIPKGGISLAGFRYSETLNEFYDAQVKQGLTAGIGLEIPIVGGLSIQPEVLFVQKGSEQKSESNQPYYDEVIDGTRIRVYDNIIEKLNYLEIPLLFKYTFLSGSYGFYLTAGPTLGLGISGTSTTTLVDLDGNPDIDDTTYDQLFKDAGYDLEYEVGFGSSDSDVYKALDLGVSLGLGLYVEAGPGKINLDARYLYGLWNMYDTGERTKGLVAVENEKQFNNTILLTLGYAIPLTGGY